MINCPKCGKKISEFAVNCPHCGEINAIHENDKLEVVALNKEQKIENQRRVIKYVTFISLILTTLGFLKYVYQCLFWWEMEVINIVPYMTSTILGVGLAFMCIHLIKRDSEWNITDKMVLSFAILKVVIYIINSILYELHTAILLLALIEMGRFRSLRSMFEINETIFDLCFCFVPMILIIFVMIKKKKSI